MASGYPTVLDNFAANKQDDIDSKSGVDLGVSTTTGDHAQHHNDLADAVNKIEAELGTDAAGTFTDVKTRLNARLTCRKTADQTFSSTTAASVTDMNLPIGTANLDYFFRFTIPWSTATSGNGIGFGVTCPALTGFIAYTVDIIRSQETAVGTAPTATQMQYVGPGISSGDTVTSDTSIQNSITIARIEGICSNPSATGTLQLTCRGETASAVIVRRGAWGEVYIN